VIGIPAFAPDGSVRAVAVADRLNLRDDELSDVRTLLLIAGPLALLLVSIAGYLLARADQGRLPLRQEPIAPSELLEAAAVRASAGARLTGREIVVEEPPVDGLLVRADPDRIAQTLDNLTTNALRYGGGTITLSARPRDGVVELHVTDEGPGFPEELIGHPFERFVRGSEERARGPGSGLGLALVEAVAMAHGGYAQARNRPEGGADVWIALPTAQLARSR
jgi:two-component system, OmpR family, sensor kinase